MTAIRPILAAVPLLVLAAMAAPPAQAAPGPPAGAERQACDATRFLCGSRASQLVQTRAMQRILNGDDALDVNCRARRFDSAEITLQPMSAEEARAKPGQQEAAAKEAAEAEVKQVLWQERWVLDRCGTPIRYRVTFTEVGLGGVYFSVENLDPEILGVVAAATGGRLLKLESPYMVGEDVRALQRQLAEAGIEVSVDGVYGPGTRDAVRAFQRREDLSVDGMVGPSTRKALATAAAEGSKKS